MPLDSAAYLTSLGWKGAGNGLRQDGMVKPIAVTKKRTLAGVGKDRDEAFPFWDHVFNAAANSIKIKIHNDSDQSDADSEQTNGPENNTLSRTSTGIISNRRPVTKISSPARPQQTNDTAENKPRLNLLAEAKRQAAYARLYANFYRGFVILPLDGQLELSDCKPEMEKQPESGIVTNCDTHIDNDTIIRRKDKSSKRHKKTRDEKENITRATEIPIKLENQLQQLALKYNTTKEIELQADTKLAKRKKRRRESITEEGELSKRKDRVVTDDVACDKDDQRKQKKRKKAKGGKELTGELSKQQDGANVSITHEEENWKKKKKKKKDKRDKTTHPT